jgi:hypothetical protein
MFVRFLEAQKRSTFDGIARIWPMSLDVVHHRLAAASSSSFGQAVSCLSIQHVWCEAYHAFVKKQKKFKKRQERLSVVV